MSVGRPTIFVASNLPEYAKMCEKTEHATVAEYRFDPKLSGIWVPLHWLEWPNNFVASRDAN